MALFALDHNYPAPIMDRARPFLRDVELVPIGEIDSRLPVSMTGGCCWPCIIILVPGTA